MVKFRRLRGSQSVSNFFRNITDLKTLQKQKGARLDAKKKEQPSFSAKNWTGRRNRPKTLQKQEGARLDAKTRVFAHQISKLVSKILSISSTKIGHILLLNI